LRKQSTQFQPGKSGNPLGRPRGSRNKLSEQFIGDLQELWAEQGPSILQRLAIEHPEKLLSAMVHILPRDFQVSVTENRPLIELSTEELLEISLKAQDSYKSLDTDEQQKIELLDAGSKPG
jgi:hypothetical protein